MLENTSGLPSLTISLTSQVPSLTFTSDAGQEAIGLLGHLFIGLLTHAPRSFSAEQLCSHPSQAWPTAWGCWVVMTQVSDLALALLECHMVGLSALILPRLHSLPTPDQINSPASRGVICRLIKGALNPLVQTID